MRTRGTVPELGPLEFSLLRILWRRSPLAAGEVLEQYNRRASKPLAYTTVMTLLTRMVEKGALSADRRRQPFQFAPAIARDALLKDRIHEFVDVFFDGRAADLAVRLIEEGPLPEEAVRRLEELLRQKPRGGKDRS